MKKEELKARKKFLFDVKEVNLDELSRAKLELEAVQYMLKNWRGLKLGGGTVLRLLEFEGKRQKSIEDLKVELGMILLQIYEVDKDLNK